MKKTLLFSIVFIAFLPQLSLGGCTQDINGDGIVDVNDFLVLLSKYGRTDIKGVTNSSDINNDGVIDVNDYLSLLGKYGQHCSTFAHVIPAVPTSTPTAVTSVAGFSSGIPALNTSLPVGTTPGSFDVSQTGNASYTIPLAVPPGTGGMVPNLAITYNSQGGDGLLGIGWSLSGLSSITRAPQSVYYNSSILPININNFDNFVLDGSYLVPTSGANGEPQTVYATESETFVKVTSDGTVFQPNLFTVETKDGTMLKYGSSNDAYICASNSSTSSPPQAVAWLLDTVIDNVGNFMKISYIQNNTTGEYYPNAIYYTGNKSANLAPYDTVKFNYKTRPDVNISYIDGHQEQHSVLLTSIQLYAQGTLVHTYTFNYSTDALSSHLSEVVETGTDGSSYNSTKIVWHNNLIVPVSSNQLNGMASDIDPYSAYPNLNNTIPGINGLFPREILEGDFNGDGFMDVVELEDMNVLPPSNTYITGITANMYLNSGTSSGFNLSSTLTYSVGSTNYFTYSSAFPDQSAIQYPPSTTIDPLDINGDGKEDLVLFSQVPSGGGYAQSFQVFLSNGTGFVQTPYTFAGLSIGVNVPINQIVFNTVSGDFDGDGISDLLVYYPYPYKNSPWGPQMYLFSLKNNAPVTVAYNYSNYLLTGDGSTYPDLMTEGLYSMDVNGDGKSELLLTAKNSQNSNFNIYVFNLNTNGTLTNLTLSNTQSNPVTALNSATLNTSGLLPNTSGSGFPAIFPGDFNGDGKSDLLMCDNYATNPNNDSRQMVYKEDWVIGYSKGDGTFTMMNVNNLFPNNGNIRIPFLYGSSFNANGFDPGNHEIVVADFNGDGKDDILDKTHTFNTGAPFIQINNPNVTLIGNTYNIYVTGYGEQPIKTNETQNMSNLTSPATDYDPFIDVRATYMTADAYGLYKPYTEINMNVFFSKGFAGTTSSNFVEKSFSLSTPNSIGPANTSTVGDFNGDGHTDFVYCGRGVEPTYMFNFDLNNQTDNGINKVIAIADGFNKTTTINYNTLPNLATSGAYTKGNNAVFPVIDIQAPYYVASHIESDNGVGGTIKTDYSYSGAKLHLQGKGFVGFTGMTATNITANLKVTNIYNAPTANNFFQTTLNECATFETTANQAVSYKMYTYTTNTLTAAPSTNTVMPVPEPHYYTYLNQLIDNDVLHGNITTYNYVQDAYGNTTQLSYTNTAVTSVTNNTFENKGSWIPHCLLTTTTTTTRSTAYTRSTTYTNNSYGKPITIAEDVGRTTAITYNSYGNIVTTTTTDNSGATPARSITNTYDTPLNRFVVQQTNALSQTTSATYSNAYGNILTSTDPNSLTTSYQYDGFGRLTQTTPPVGAPINITRSFDNSGLTNSLYLVSTTQTGAPSTTTYFDKLGRDLRTQVTGFDGTLINTDKIYNNLGQPISSSEPYYNTTGSPVYNTSTYDAYFRPNVITAVSGATTALSYSGNTATATITTGSGTKTISKTMDASGLLASVTDPGGTLTYAYHGCGKPLTISNSTGGNNVTMTYDNYGRQTILNDPDVGQMTYTYNAFDDVQSQKDASNNTHTLTYDALGRIKTNTSSGSDGTITYNYDNASGKGVGKIASVTNSSGSSLTGNQTYAYDTYSRLQSISELMPDTKYYTTTYTYNTNTALNQITGITYPSGFSINYTYNSQGYLFSITDPTPAGNNNNTLIWQCNSMTPRNQLLSATNGNGGTINKSYDSYGLGFLTTITATENGVTAMNDNYTFDLTNGNLISRTNNLYSGLTENFTYDNLDRILTAAIGNNTPYQSTSIASSGNITTKSDVGNYNYTGTQPHAVSSITNPTPNVPTAEYVLTTNSINKTSVITQQGNEVDYAYGPDWQRKQAVFKTNAVATQTIIYSGNYEKTITSSTTYEVHYIASPDGLVAMDVRTTPSGGSASDAMYYVHTDHLGSLNSIYNASGNKVAEQSFDPWGRQRNPTNWSYTYTPTLLTWLIRGYTGHEQLPQFGLINMNARLYDPLLAHVVSPDDYLQFPDFSQSYNRFSYCINNPLKYTDPSGNDIDGGTFEFTFYGKRGGGGGDALSGLMSISSSSGGGGGVDGNGKINLIITPFRTNVKMDYIIYVKHPDIKIDRPTLPPLTIPTGGQAQSQGGGGG